MIHKAQNTAIPTNLIVPVGEGAGLMKCKSLSGILIRRGAIGF